MAKGTKIYKRKLRATLHRTQGNSAEVIWVRYFNVLHRCMAKGIEEALLTGQPGDCLEITSSNFGYLIATVLLKVQKKKNLSGIEIVYNLAEPVKI